MLGPAVWASGTPTGTARPPSSDSAASSTSSEARTLIRVTVRSDWFFWGASASGFLATLDEVRRRRRVFLMGPCGLPLQALVPEISREDASGLSDPSRRSTSLSDPSFSRRAICHEGACPTRRSWHAHPQCQEGSECFFRALGCRRRNSSEIGRWFARLASDRAHPNEAYRFVRKLSKI